MRKSSLVGTFSEFLLSVGVLALLSYPQTLDPKLFLIFTMAFFVFLRVSKLDRILPGTFSDSDYRNLLLFAIGSTAPVATYFFVNSSPFDAFFKSSVFFVFQTFIVVVMRTLIKHRKRLLNSRKADVRTLVIGAGNAGEQIVTQIQRKEEGYSVTAIVDDDKKKQGKTLLSVPIVGTVEDIPKVVFKHSIDLALIAIPSANHKQVSRIVQLCMDSGVGVKILPDTFQVLDDTVNLGQIRDISIEDLLTRNSISLDTDSMTQYLKSRHVFVTGAGGSIGSELCFQACKLGCQTITLFDNSEFGLYEIDLKLREKFPDVRVNSIIGDVRDEKRIQSTLEKYSPNVVFHAAAYKHVPLMEDNPTEAINTNVKGTLNTLRSAQAANVEQFIFVSTDKAVNPTNIMGTTKRLAEILIQLNRNEMTKTNIVRFGNVLNSKGSVIPRFLEQIRNGGPLTVTDPEITRYFMSIPEAVQLVLKAATFERDNEIFLLDMGEPVKIYDVAKNLIKLHGLVPEKDIVIEFTGLRPGEKLYEELLADTETTTPTPDPKIRTAKTSSIPSESNRYNDIFQRTWDGEKVEIVKSLKEYVPEYSPEST